ncbi:DUF2339 domain-containing protein [Microlunatus sp. GCM10028923]|uniref:DUF2339 domain-containing protein n=1 Tax=Microlunatus sp. GCM10028923 TaxID=3273400 RepID=UPI00360B22A1
MARLLTVAGALVLLVGIAFLLVLAIQAGLFGPVPRVITGSVVSAALIGVALLLRRRLPTNPGPIALAASGIAGGYLVVVAVASIYAWVPFYVGLALATLLAVLGCLLAHRWDSQTLAVIVLVGVILLAPGVGLDRPWTAAALLVLLSGVITLLQLDRRWPVVHAVRVVPTALVLITLAGTRWAQEGFDITWFGAALTTVFALLVVAVEYVLLRCHGDHPGLAAISAIMIGIALLTPMIAVRVLLEDVRADIWLLALAAVWCGFAVLLRTPGRRAVLISGAALTVAVGVAGFDQVGLVGATFMIISATLLALAGAGVDRVVGWVGVGVGLVAFLFYLAVLPSLVIIDSALPTIWNLLASCAGVLAAVAAGSFARRAAHGADVRVPMAVAWVAAMITGTGVLVIAGQLAGAALGARQAGFLVGHATATFGLMIVASWFLLRSLARAGRGLVGGLITAGVAVAKLLIFDLATLDGVIRVLAFVAIGVVLLALGTFYAKALSAARSGPG